jgi:demethylmenaquinone methyltransferase/2-methoxy-6-polyprenyl-1,4-benzoquinol methylase
MAREAQGRQGAGADRSREALADGEHPRFGQPEAEQVQAMFDRIAWVYDALNGVMTAGLHHRWRARAVDLAQVRPGSRVLDLATGTGDLALELARRVAPDGEVVGSDFSEAMLTRARAKWERARHSLPDSTPASVRFEWGDALRLPYENDSFDAATVGFGARNFSDLARGLREMARVVRPGGRVVVLEMTSPTRPPLSSFFALWFDRVVPLLGRLAGDSDAYSYLPNSVKRFPAPAILAAEMERAGIGEIGYLLTAGGIIAIHAGTVPTNGP